MKGVCTEFGLKTSVRGFKRAGAQRRFPFLPFLLKYAVVASEKSHPVIPTKSLAVPSTDRQVVSYVRSSIHFSLNSDVSEDYPKQAMFAKAGHKITHTRKSITEAKSLVFTRSCVL